MACIGQIELDKVHAVSVGCVLALMWVAGAVNHLRTRLFITVLMVACLALDGELLRLYDLVGGH